MCRDSRGSGTCFRPTRVRRREFIGRKMYQTPTCERLPAFTASQNSGRHEMPVLCWAIKWPMSSRKLLSRFATHHESPVATFCGLIFGRIFARMTHATGAVAPVVRRGCLRFNLVDLVADGGGGCCSRGGPGMAAVWRCARGKGRGQKAEGNRTCAEQLENSCLTKGEFAGEFRGRSADRFGARYCSGASCRVNAFFSRADEGEGEHETGELGTRS